MSASTLSVLALPREVEEFIQTAAEARGVSNEEFVRLHLIEAAEKFFLLKAEIDEGLRGLREGKGTPAQDVFDRIRESHPNRNRTGYKSSE
jgi:hypothetical protein